jgi:cytochrome c oxidase subunit 2
MSITPPAERLWWKEPIERVELMWVLLVFAWGILMFIMMPYWHIYGKQNLSNEAYRTTPEIYGKKVEDMVAQYTVRKETAREMPVVAPPPGTDVYLLGRLWEWYPILELKKGESYRLHISSMDWLHGLSIQPVNINMQIHPNYDMVVTITPDKAGEYSIVCNEFCGIGHHQMIGKIYVKE